MDNATSNLIQQLQDLRRLFADAAPTDTKTICDYGWIIAKALNHEHVHLGSVECRQLLHEYLKLPIDRPSKLHSVILSAAIKVANTYPDFRFAVFLKLWDVRNLRPEDNERQHTQDGKTFPSLTERAFRTLAHSLLLHPENRPLLDSADDSGLSSQLADHGFCLQPMLVTRMKEATGKDGRKYRFVTLTSAEGLEVEVISQKLQPSPLHSLPEGKRHFVNFGQLYDVVLRLKATTVPDSDVSEPVIHEAYLSSLHITDFFSSEIGYIESIDIEHSHMHIFDAHSRHFVAPIQRFSKERVGDFVRFIPIVPQLSKFKTAILLSIIPATSPEVSSILRDVRITSINNEKGYASWELIDASHPITELLSSFQLSQGQSSPSFTTGYLHLTPVPDAANTGSILKAPPVVPCPLSPGQTLRALIYLKRGRDHQKRPFVARIF